MKRNCDGFTQKLVQQQQVTEKLRTELMNSHSQNQELSHKLTSLKAANLSPKSKSSKMTTISFSRMESPKASFSANHEGNEWQKKYEVSKGDNERLIKIVEENHKSLKNFRDIFSELEKRHNINYDELKREYENRIRCLSDCRSDSRISTNNGRDDLLNRSSIISSSFPMNSGLKSPTDR